MGSDIGVFIGVVVLLLSVGLVAVMMAQEWSVTGTEVLEEKAPGAAPRRAARPAAPKKAAPAKAKAPAKKKAAPPARRPSAARRG